MKTKHIYITFYPLMDCYCCFCTEIIYSHTEDTYPNWLPTRWLLIGDYEIINVESSLMEIATRENRFFITAWVNTGLCRETLLCCGKNPFAFIWEGQNRGRILVFKLTNVSPLLRRSDFENVELAALWFGRYDSETVASAVSLCAVTLLS